MQSLKRPWTSDFDLEFYDWEKEKESGGDKYAGIAPVHVTEKWYIEVGAGVRNKFVRGYRKTLAEAVELRDHFRSINQRDTK